MEGAKVGSAEVKQRKNGLGSSHSVSLLTIPLVEGTGGGGPTGGGVELGDAQNRILGGRSSGTIGGILTRKTKWRSTGGPTNRFQGEDRVYRCRKLGGWAVVLNLAIGQIRFKIGGRATIKGFLLVKRFGRHLAAPHVVCQAKIQ